MKSEVINFRMNPKKAEDRLILDYLSQRITEAENENGPSGNVTQTDVIKQVFLDVIENDKQRRQEQLRREETTEFVKQVTESVKEEITQLMQEHDMKMMATILSVISGNIQGGRMINSEEMDVMKAPGYAEKQLDDKAEDKNLQELDNLPMTEEVMDDDIKAGLMSMFN